MGWTTPRTWVAGETVTAAIMNTHVRDNLNAVPGTLLATASSASTATSTGTTEALHAGLTVSPTTIENGRWYFLEMSGRFGIASGTVPSVCIVKIHASQSAITTGSPVVGYSQCAIQATGGTGAFDLTYRIPWQASAAGTWNFQVGVVCNIAGANASFGLGGANCTLSVVTGL